MEKIVSRPADVDLVGGRGLVASITVVSPQLTKGLQTPSLSTKRPGV